MKIDNLYSLKAGYPVYGLKSTSNANKNNIAFQANYADALTHVNIGSKADGYIGKFKVRLAKGGDAVLNVFKRYTGVDKENYIVKNDYDEVIGEMNLFIRKITSYNPWEVQKGDPSHVFVDELRNYSKPGTPYYTDGLTPHKDIGTRLLQIAQRRSDEAGCCGNIKLISKGESKDWYLNYIKMRQEFPVPKFGICINNPNQLYLPPESKEGLSKLAGGL